MVRCGEAAITTGGKLKRAGEEEGRAAAKEGLPAPEAVGAVGSGEDTQHQSLSEAAEGSHWSGV